MNDNEKARFERSLARAVKDIGLHYVLRLTRVAIHQPRPGLVPRQMNMLFERVDPLVRIAENIAVEEDL
jgi:hypothetical protein